MEGYDLKKKSTSGSFCGARSLGLSQREQPNRFWPPGNELSPFRKLRDPTLLPSSPGLECWAEKRPCLTILTTSAHSGDGR